MAQDKQTGIHIFFSFLPIEKFIRILIKSIQSFLKSPRPIPLSFSPDVIMQSKSLITDSAKALNNLYVTSLAIPKRFTESIITNSYVLFYHAFSLVSAIYLKFM